MHYGMQGPLVFQRPRVGQGFPYLCVNAWPEKPKIPEGKINEGTAQLLCK
jgi:hypothetical protein